MSGAIHQIPKPNFFIIGAPRCGTTALSEYLRQHPAVGFAEPKESQFFCTDLPSIRIAKDEKAYLAQCFSHTVGKGFSSIGDGSVWHLFSDEAIQNILRFDRKARFIMMVRNPLDLCMSLHQKCFEMLWEEEPSFERAWSLQPSRAQGQRIPKRCPEPRLLQYASVGCLGRQVGKAFSLIPEDQRIVIIFDDFTKDTARVYANVLQFLNVCHDGRHEFPKINERKHVRNRWLLELTWYPPGPLMKTADLFKRITGVARLHILPRLRPRLLREATRAPLSDRLRREMVELFSEDIDLLARLLRRDLSHWKTGAHNLTGAREG